MEVEDTALRETESCVVTATDGLVIEQCPEQPSLRLPRVGKQCGNGMAARKSGCKAQAEAR